MGMTVERTSTPIDISVSGLKAESLRMKVISNNIANANTTGGADGKPYRRQQVILSTSGDMSGVEIKEVAPDTSSDFKKVYEPGPDADKDGYVSMPNVNLPDEMMAMVLSNRSYQANAAALKRYQDMVESALELLK